MDIITLLGVILDKMAFEDDVEHYYDIGNSKVVTIYATPEIKEYAESLLDNGDYIEVERDEYDTITVSFVDNHIDEVYYGKEKHNVEHCINNYVVRWHINDIYEIMCSKILSLF